MAIQHAKPGEVIDIKTFGPDFTDTHTAALVKTDQFETIRLFVEAGGSIPQHRVNGPITVQCLRGEAVFFVEDEARTMVPGTWLHLDGSTVHSIDAKTDCVLLVTIVFVADNAD